MGNQYPTCLYFPNEKCDSDGGYRTGHAVCQLQPQANILQSSVQNDEDASKKAYKTLNKLMSRQGRLQRQFKTVQYNLNKNVRAHSDQLITIQQQQDALEALKLKQ